MKELALNILDIAENSVRAGAAHIEISVADAGSRRTLTITDDGCGMDEALLRRVTDPFATTRTTRPVGLGLPLLKLAAEQTGGTLTIASRTDRPSEAACAETFAAGCAHGTRVRAEFDTGHIDCVPMGDLPATMVTLVQGNPEIDVSLTLDLTGMAEPFRLDTRQMREVLGGDVPLDAPEVLLWLRESVAEAMETAGTDGFCNNENERKNVL